MTNELGLGNYSRSEGRRALWRARVLSSFRTFPSKGSRDYDAVVANIQNVGLGDGQMFRVKWVTHLSDIGIIETENGINRDLDELVYSCIERLSNIESLSKIQIGSFGTQPDGFLIFNDEEVEVRRWFSSPSPSQMLAQLHIQNNPRKIVFFSDETITWCKSIPQDWRH